MLENKMQIRELINKGIGIIDKMGIFYTNARVGNNTMELIKVIKSLFPLIQNQQPIISNVLADATLRLNDNGIINAFTFCDGAFFQHAKYKTYCKEHGIEHEDHTWIS